MGVNLNLWKCTVFGGSCAERLKTMPALQNSSAMVKMLSFPQAAPGPGDPRKQRSSVGGAGDWHTKPKPTCLETCGVAG